MNSPAGPRYTSRRRPAAQPTGSEADFAPRARPLGSLLFLAGAWFTAFTMRGEPASHLAHYAAIGVGLSLMASVLIDMREGLLNLIRADLLAISALYFLTLFEFLFKQENFDAQTDVASTHQALIAVITGFSGMVIGRHLPNLKQKPLKKLFLTPTPRSWLIMIFLGCLFLGTLNMLMAVDFNPMEMIHYFMAPRFTQPWSRERLGDWKALLHEFDMVLELVPPIAGVIFGRRSKFTRFQLFIVAAGFAFVLFYGFSGGTRNVFATYLVTFLISYAFALPLGRKKELIVASGLCAVLLFVSSILMLQFREIGLEKYVEGGYKYNIEHADEESLFIDYNLYSICRIVEIFPEPQPYLGWEVPFLAIVRPVPRAMWPGKPEGLSFSLEDALGVEGLTVAASFIGEAFMSGGLIAVFIAGLVFGIIMGWWSHLASARNSELGILIYASGFLAAVISMRSLFVFTTAILPTLFAIIGGHFLVSIWSKKAKRASKPMRRIGGMTKS